MSNFLLIGAILLSNLMVAESRANIDTLEPIIRGLPVDINNSYQKFGYSALLHQFKDPASMQPEEFTDNTRIIVGAPSGRSPDSVLNTGLVYICPVGPGDCELLAVGPINESVNTGNSVVDRFGYNFTEQKQNQLLGASMATSFGRFAVCAPLYTVLNETYLWYNGKCFLSDDRNLESFTSVEACKRGGEALYTNLSPQLNVYNCVTGTASIGDQLSNTPESLFFFSQPMFDNGGGSAADYFRGDYIDDLYSVADQSFSHFSYSMAFGFVTKKTEINSIFTNYLAVDTSKFYVFEASDSVMMIDAPHVCRDGKIPSNTADCSSINIGYGASLLTAVLSDNGGYDWILVGAPLKPSSYDSPEVGAVYVYKNTGGAVDSNPIVLTGSGVAFGRFGYAMANLGDISVDGYDDVAISAPYEGMGTVYVFISKEDGTGLNRNFVQKIEASALNTDVLGSGGVFGHALYSQVDVDGNKYNDLLISSVESQQVIVLRSLPIVKVNTTVTQTTIGNVFLDNKDCNGYACFVVEACVNVLTNQTRFTGDSFGLEFTLIGDANKNVEVQRTFFLTENGTNVKNITGLLTVNSSVVGASTCINYTVHVRNVIVDSRSDFNVVFQVKQIDYQVNKTDGNQTLSDLNSRPVVVVPDEASSLTVKPDYCGDDEICHTNLSIHLIERSYDPPEKEYIVAGDSSEFKVQFMISNNGEDAYDTKLNISYKKGIIGFQASMGLLNCLLLDGEKDIVTKQCPVSTRLRHNESAVFEVSFSSVSTEPLNEDFDITFKVFADPLGIELTPEDDEFQTSGNITSMADLRVSEVSLSPFELDISDSAASEVPLTLTINVIFSSDGPTSLPNASVTLTLPNATSDGRHKIIEPIEFPENCNIKLPMDSSRRKRQEQQSRNSSAQTGSIETIDCNDVDVSCLSIVCTTGPFQSEDSGQNAEFIMLTANFYPGYIQEKKTPSMNVRIEASINVAEQYDFYIDPGNNNNAQSFLLVNFLSTTVAPASGVAWWIIVVPIVIALLLLIVIIFILYFCGFFKRKRSSAEPTVKVEVLSASAAASAAASEEDVVKQQDLNEETQSNNMKQSDSDGSIGDDNDYNLAPEKDSNAEV